MDPAVEISIFEGKFLIFSPVGLQPGGHLGVLLEEKFQLEVLILHELNNFISPKGKNRQYK